MTQGINGNGSYNWTASTGANKPPAVATLPQSPTSVPFLVANWLSKPWAMSPEALNHYAEFAHDLATLAEQDADRRGRRIETRANNDTVAGDGKVRVVPLYGMLLPRADVFSEMCGLGTSLQKVVDAVRAAATDSRVEQIVLDIDSPGGPVSGVLEAAAELSEIRASTDTPITAISRYTCASSAYWIACASADEIVASPSSETGSIGVFSVHIDRSSAYSMEGLNIELVAAGKYKTEAADTSPLTAEARGHLQGKADYYYSAFLDAVAEARGASVRDVQDGYGQGRTLVAGDALKANLVDRVGAISDYLSPRANARQSAEPPDIAALITQAFEERE